MSVKEYLQKKKQEPTQTSNSFLKNWTRGYANDLRKESDDRFRSYGVVEQSRRVTLPEYSTQQFAAPKQITLPQKKEAQPKPSFVDKIKKRFEIPEELVEKRKSMEDKLNKFYDSFVGGQVTNIGLDIAPKWNLAQRIIGSVSDPKKSSVLEFQMPEKDKQKIFSEIEKMTPVEDTRFAKEVAQAISRSFVAYGNMLLEGDLEASYTPEDTIARTVLGTSMPVSLENIGREMGQITGHEETMPKPLAIGIGSLIASLDVSPISAGTRRAIMVGSQKIAKTKSVKTISGIVRELFPKADDEVIVALSKNLINANDEKVISKTLTGAYNVLKEERKRTLALEARRAKVEKQRAGIRAKLGKEVAEQQATKADPLIQEGVPGVAGLRKVGLFEPTKIVRKKETTLLKDRIRNYARGVREGNIQTKKDVARVQSELVDLIKKSDLDLSDQAKFLSTLKNVQTQEQLNKALPTIERRVNTLIEASDKRVLTNLIDSELKIINAQKSGGIPRGKLTAETQKALEDIRHYTKMKATEANAKLYDILSEGKDITPELAREIDLLRMAGIRGEKIGNKIIPSQKTSKELQYILDNIKALKQEGMTKNELKAFNYLSEMEAMKETGVEAITGGLGLRSPALGIAKKRKGIRAMASGLDNWLHGIDTIFDKLSVLDPSNTGRFDGFLNRKFATRVHSARNAQDASMQKYSTKIQDKFKEVWGAKSKREMAKIVNKNKEENILMKFTDANGEVVSRKLSPNQIYKKWMELQDETLEQTFKEGMGWTDEATKFINDFMDANPKLKAWAKWQLDEFYPSYGKSIAPAYEARFNMPFPSRKNYSPILRDGKSLDSGTDASLLDNVFHMTGVNPHSIKSRTGSIAPLQFSDGDLVLSRHLVEMEHFKAFEGIIRDMRNFFGDPRIKRAIDQLDYGNIGSIVNRLIDDIAQDGVKAGLKINALDVLRGNWIRAKLGINPGVALKQLGSIPAFITEMPAGAAVGDITEFLKYSGSFWTNPMKNTKILMESDALIARYSNLDRDIKLLMQRRAPEKIIAGKDGFLNMLMFPTRWGDRAAIIQGGWAVYKSNYDRFLLTMSKDKAHKKALQKFEEAFLRTQQAGQIESLSQLQRMGSFGNLFTMFITAPNQYYRIASRSVRNLANGVGNPATNLRNLAIAWVVLPSIFQFISDGFRVDTARQKRAMLLGPLNGIPMLGENIEDITRALTGDDIFGSSSPGPLGTAGKLSYHLGSFVKKWKVDDVKTEDVYKMIEALTMATGDFTGLPAQALKNLKNGVEAIYEGEDPRLLIFSEYALGRTKGDSVYEYKELIKDKEWNKLEERMHDEETNISQGRSALRDYFNMVGSIDNNFDLLEGGGEPAKILIESYSVDVQERFYKYIMTRDKRKVNAEMKAKRVYEQIKDKDPKEKREEYNKLTDIEKVMFDKLLVDKAKQESEKQKRQEKLDQKLGK